MSLLHGRLELGSVRDAEAIARIAIIDATRRDGSHLSHHDREDAVSAVIVAAWRGYERCQERGAEWNSSICYVVCRRGFVDHLRSRYGRSRWQFADHIYERERVVVVSLDDKWDDGDGGASRADRVGESFGGGSVDPQERGDPGLERLLTRRGRPPDWLRAPKGAAAAR